MFKIRNSKKTAETKAATIPPASSVASASPDDHGIDQQDVFAKQDIPASVISAGVAPDLLPTPQPDAGLLSSTPAACHVSKLDQLAALLRQDGGASIAELCEALHWQAHSVRGAMAGSLKRKGHVISSQVVSGSRRYHITGAL